MAAQPTHCVPDPPHVGSLTSTHRNRTLRLEQGSSEFWFQETQSRRACAGESHLASPPAGCGSQARPLPSGTSVSLLYKSGIILTHFLGHLKELRRQCMEEGISGSPQTSPRRCLNTPLWGKHCPHQLFISMGVSLGRGLPLLSLQRGWTSADSLTVGTDQGTQTSKFNQEMCPIPLSSLDPLANQSQCHPRFIRSCQSSRLLSCSIMQAIPSTKLSVKPQGLCTGCSIHLRHCP